MRIGEANENVIIRAGCKIARNQFTVIDLIIKENVNYALGKYFKI